MRRESVLQNLVASHFNSSGVQRLQPILANYVKWRKWYGLLIKSNISQENLSKKYPDRQIRLEPARRATKNKSQNKSHVISTRFIQFIDLFLVYEL